MRLLNVESGKLESFLGPNRPLYAILSHTWGKEEVLLSDIKDVGFKLSPAAKAKSAYTKVEETCRKVAELPLQLKYCWIDTCCIDKDSSAELSEAINSMFAWYRDATVCFAYLDDVKSSSVWEDLPKAKWFKRGWTLQELIAPRKVEFYSKDWVKIDSKDTGSERITPFVQKLSVITNIDEMVLWNPAYMKRKSVAARMSWAYKRKTSRKEDLAYCLMGLFDVNMPLLYGEGDRAFIRLQEEVIKTSDDHSIFAWDSNGKSSTVSCLADRPKRFARGALVVPFGRKQSHSASYALTNQGIQIDLPLYQDPTSNIVYGLINCHWENTFTACIGIPLRGNQDSQFFERSSQHELRDISAQEMSEAKKRIVFLSTRPVVEFPLAAEVILQVYDRTLKQNHGFYDVVITNNPLASRSWLPEYHTFALRWPVTTEMSKLETVDLLWRLGRLCLTVRINGKLEDRGNDETGHFDALSIDIFTDMDRSTPRVNQSSPVALDPLESTCLINFEQAEIKSKSVIGIMARLRKQDIFGNEIYTLEVREKD